MNKLIRTFIIACIGLIGLTQVHAASIALLPSASSVQLGDTITLTIVGDFTDVPTVGGGFDIFYNDDLLSFSGFVIDPGLGDDAAFRRAPDDLANELNGFAFGSFFGFDGPIVIGELSFVAIAQGFVSLTMATNEGGPSPTGQTLLNPGPFSTLTGMEIGPDQLSYEGAEVQVVPLPGAVWMMLSAIGLLSGWRRSSKVK